MLTVVIWNVRNGVERSTAIASMRECAIHYGDKYQRDADACNYVDRVYKCNDKCASSANASPMGFRIQLKDVSPEQYSEFNRCFNVKEVDIKSEPRLKVFAANVTGKDKPRHATIQTTRNVHNLLILALGQEEVFVILRNKYPNIDAHVFTVEEIEGPFTTGQILMDDGGHTMHDMDIAKRANS